MAPDFRSLGLGRALTEPPAEMGVLLSPCLSQEGDSGLFTSYTSDWKGNLISRHRKALLTATLILIALAVGGLFLSRLRGVKALRPGMSRFRVIAALGQPTYVYQCNESFCLTSLTGKSSTTLIYKQDANTVLTVGLDEQGIIYEQTVADIQGPKDERTLCSITAYVLARAHHEGIRASSSSNSQASVKPLVILELTSADPRTGMFLLKGDTFLGVYNEWKIRIKEYHPF